MIVLECLTVGNPSCQKTRIEKNGVKKIPTIQPDTFKWNMLSYFDPGYFEKKHYNDFFIHKLSQPIYTPKLPMSLHRQAVNLVLLLTNGKMIKKSGLTDYTVGKNGLFLLPQGHITDTTLFNENSDGYFVHFSNNFLISKSIDL